MDKLKIGIFLQSYIDDRVGGGFSYLTTLIEAIDNYKFDPQLELSFIDTGSSNHLPVRNKILRIEPHKIIPRKTKYSDYFNTTYLRPTKKLLKPIKRLNQWLETAFEKEYYKAIELELKKNEVDLIYYITPEPHKLNYPFVCTHWDAGHRSMFCFPEVAMNDSFAYRQHYFQTTIEKAFAVYCESNAGRKELIRYTGINEERLFVVPLFPGKVVDLFVNESDQARHLHNYGLTANAFFFYPAQFWSHKNHYNLLLAFKKLNEIYPQIKLLFTGSDKGNLEYIKKVLVDLHLENNVVMPGFVEVEEIHSFYKNALALVMPTFLGPTNMPLLEAEALGCPVICSDLEGHREMLNKNASYILPDDPQTIFDALLIHSSSVGEKANQINPVFNIQNAVKQIESNFLKIKPRRKSFGSNFNQF
ncbi:MAG: glycosyltransferase [Chitinophagaceae bacterium]|nr:MAG: glycosyltransferase [Chitinophagaceae bacterium]